MCPVDHQAMNGQVERVQGVLAAKMRALLMDGRLDSKYWPLALETAMYLTNRTPHESLGGLSPIEKSTGKKPDLGRTRIFGCTAYMQIPKAGRKGKLSDVAWQGILVGYSTQSPEWVILEPRTGNLRRAYSVTSDDNVPCNTVNKGNVVNTEDSVDTDNDPIISDNMVEKSCDNYHSF